MATQSLLLEPLDRLGRFSDCAQDYARYWPSYPSEAIASILADLRDRTTLVMADIDAGIVTRHIAPYISSSSSSSSSASNSPPDSWGVSQ